MMSWKGFGGHNRLMCLIIVVGSTWTDKMKKKKIVSHVEEDIGDTKGVIRIRKSNKDRQNNGEK
jgi:hypothetical protein